jgi:MFS family permease
MGQVGTIGVIGAVVTTLTYPLWGVLVDRVGATSALRIGTALGLVSVVGYAVAPDVVLLWAAAAAMGAAGAATDTAIVALLADETSLEERGAALAGWNGSTGVWGIAPPIAMSLLVGSGLLSVQAGLVIAAAVTASGVALYLAPIGQGERVVRRSGSRVVSGVRGAWVAAVGR